MNKSSALQIIIQCAQEFDVYLKNKNLLFLMSDKGDKLYFFEGVFLSKHFKHLTGVKTSLGSNDFYRASLNGKLSETDFDLPKTAELKLQVLSQAMNIEKTAKMCGEFNNSGFDLFTQKLVGNIQLCVGMVQDEKTQYYVPNTLLKADIRNKTFPPISKIICVLKKEIKDTFYNQICSIGKNISLSKIKYPPQMVEKLSESLKYRCGIISEDTFNKEKTSENNKLEKITERNQKTEAKLKAISSENEKRRNTISTVNAILNENPELKRQFIQAKEEFELKQNTEKAKTVPIGNSQKLPTKNKHSRH